jgi:hypothetical protein
MLPFNPPPMAPPITIEKRPDFDGADLSGRMPGPRTTHLLSKNVAYTNVSQETLDRDG